MSYSPMGRRILNNKDVNGECGVDNCYIPFFRHSQSISDYENDHWASGYVNVKPFYRLGGFTDGESP